MPYMFAGRSLRRMQGVHPILTQCATEALDRSHYDMTIPWMGGCRTPEQQKEIFDRGASRADGVEKISNHQTGMALDIEPVGYNASEPDKKYLASARNHFAQQMFNTFADMKARGDVPDGMSLHWGGLWGSTGWDKPHWELREQ